jgi:hypothetical protein
VCEGLLKKASLFYYSVLKRFDQSLNHTIVGFLAPFVAGVSLIFIFFLAETPSFFVGAYGVFCYKTLY